MINNNLYIKNHHHYDPHKSNMHGQSGELIRSNTTWLYLYVTFFFNGLLLVKC